MSLAPTHIGAYRLLRKLGQGGMGSVYEALQETIERRVAIKILRAEYANDADITKRFFNEARAVNRIDHPSIVQIHEHGHLPDGTAYIVMEFLKGETLALRMQQLGGRVPVPLAVQIIWQVAAALTAAHDKSIVHRDLKPTNLMLVPDQLVAGGERVKVLDFGIAKLVADAFAGKTATSLVMGTPTYMSPEQCRGAGTVDEKTDVYSLGVILFEMLVGRPPFVAEGAGELMGMHLFQPPPAVAELVPDISSDLAELVQLLLSKDRSRRPSMREVFHQFTPPGASGSVALTLTKVAAPPPPSESATIVGVGAQYGHHDSTGRAGRSGMLQIAGDQRSSGARRRRPLVTALLISGVLAAAGLTFSLLSGPGTSVSHKVQVQAPSIPEMKPPITVEPIVVAPAEVVDKNVPEPASASAPASAPTSESAPASAPTSESAPASESAPELPSHGPKKSPPPKKKRERLVGDGKPASALDAAAPPPKFPPTKIPSDTNDRLVLDSILNDAQTAFISGNSKKALELARLTQKDRPGPAFLIIGLSACKLRDVKLADEAFQRLDATRQQSVIDACLKQNIVHQRGMFLQDAAPTPHGVELAERFLLDAEKAFSTGANEQTLDLAWRAVQGLPGPTFVYAQKRKAWTLYGRAACKVHRLPAVSAACAALPDRSQLAEECAGYGITIDASCVAR